MKTLMPTTLLALAAMMLTTPGLAQDTVSQTVTDQVQCTETGTADKEQKKMLMQQKRAERKAAMQQKRAERKAAMQQSDNGNKQRRGRKGRKRREGMRSVSDEQSSTAE